MSKDKFEEFIDRHTKNKSANQEDVKARLLEWLGYIDEFYKTTEAILADYISSKRILVSYSDIEINEEFIGPYSTKEATITIGDILVRLTPIGTRLIGARGRIDMRGPKGTVKFVLVDGSAKKPRITVKIVTEGESPPAALDPASIQWAWRIGTPPPNIEYVVITKETYLEALMEVANG